MNFPIPKLIIILLFIVALIISVNTFVQNSFVWYLADALFIIIPILFSFNLMRTMRHGQVTAALLWAPVPIVIFMWCSGLLGIDHIIWNITNTYQLFVCGLLIGSRLDLFRSTGDEE